MSKVFCKKCGSNVKNGRCTECGMTYVMHDRSRELDEIFQGRPVLPDDKQPQDKKLDEYGGKTGAAPHLPKKKDEIPHQNHDDETHKIKSDDDDHSKEKKNRLQQWLLPVAAACALLTAVILVCIITTGSPSKEHDAEVIAVITPTGAAETGSIDSKPAIDMDNTINSDPTVDPDASSDNTPQPTPQINPEPYESPEATPELPDLSDWVSQEDTQKDDAATDEGQLASEATALPETTGDFSQKKNEQIETDADEKVVAETPESTDLTNEVSEDTNEQAEASEGDKLLTATSKLPETTGELPAEKREQMETVVDEGLISVTSEPSELTDKVPQKETEQISSFMRIIRQLVKQKLRKILEVK